MQLEQTLDDGASQLLPLPSLTEIQSQKDCWRNIAFTQAIGVELVDYSFLDFPKFSDFPFFAQSRLWASPKSRARIADNSWKTPRHRRDLPRECSLCRQSARSPSIRYSSANRLLSPRNRLPINQVTML